MNYLIANLLVAWLLFVSDFKTVFITYVIRSIVLIF